ncbi:hypothetical protein GDO78_010355 [Eleutherodactylus coqui]|uniref:Tetratricopeptide repeat domain 6 n=1 Tax=Eleutherodactylus coqui TaxID=57060 RepID=A0A8J6F682_ELECQ|nr:hypothetical protein GDO78_010355 [Eleutherodactylus coqui]
MSDRRGHLHFRLNYAEELRIKKELERLLKPPHRAIRHDMVELRPKSSSPLSRMKDPSILQSNQFNSLSRPRSEVRGKQSSAACQSAPTSAASRIDAVSNTVEIRHEDEEVCGSTYGEVTQEPKDQTQPQHSQLYVLGTEHNVMRPSIASLVGTTKPIIVSTRPEPPSKPRSYMLQDSVKCRIVRKAPVKEKVGSKKQKVAPLTSSKMKKAVEVRPAEDTDDTSTSSSSDSQNSEDSESRITSGKKEKEFHRLKLQTLATSDQAQVGDPIVVELPHVVEATLTHSNVDQNDTKGIESVVSSVKTKARSVDEIIASLRSPQSYTASDLMIKQLMESVLGVDYNVASPEITEEETDVQEREAKLPQLERTETFVEAQLLEQSELLVPEADVVLTVDKLSTQSSLPMDKDEEETSQRFMSSGETSILSLKVEEMTEAAAKEILKSSAKISVSDIISVKGDAALLTRRNTAKTWPSAALLATWKPMTKGQYLYEMKKYDLASFCIHYTAEMTEGSSPVQQALVQSFLQQNSSAIDCLVSAINNKPVPALIILLGKIQMKAKKNKEASESFRMALDLLSQLEERSSTSDKAEVFYLLGLCYMEQFKFLPAFEALTSAVKNRSGYGDAYYQRGLCRMRLQQSKCVQDFNKALQINPKHLQAYLCRAAFYGFRKRYSKAIMNCNAAIKVQPRSVRAYLYRGALKYYIKAYKLAIQDLTKATELDPSCSLVYYNRGVCYHQMKIYEEALKDYGIVLILGGWKEVDVKVLVNRGLLYLELHDYANALEDFKAVAMKTPGDVKIHQVIGNCHHRLQQYAEAVRAFSQVLQINPLIPEGYIGRGNAYMEYGHVEGIKCAQEDFVKALHLKPSCIDARICLGYNLQAQGRLQQAWNQFTVTLDIDARSMLGFEGRAIVNLQMGDTFAALQDMNAALKACRNDMSNFTEGEKKVAATLK